MPGFNKQGPMGQGPMTGRKQGRCTNFGAGRTSQTTNETENTETPANQNIAGQGFGQGFGRRCGKGMGRGMGRNGGGQGMGRQNRSQGDV